MVISFLASPRKGYERLFQLRIVMLKMRKYVLLALALLHFVVGYSQQENIQHSVGFRVNRIRINPSFRDNKQQVEEISEFAKIIREDSTLSIQQVVFGGAASPEGSDGWNRYLAKHRREALESVVFGELDIADSIIVRDTTHIPWDYLITQVEASDMAYKDRVLSILNEEPSLVYYRKGKQIDQRIVKLWRLNNGKVWRQLFDSYFADMRYAYVIFDVAVKPMPLLMASSTYVAPSLAPEVSSSRVEPIPTPIPDVDIWTPNLYLKSNIIGLGMLNANIAGEADIVRHLSVSLPIYYSAINYFKSTIKFRNLSVQPELRYWFSEDNDRWFVGAHMGLSYYNFAFDGDYRFQDHNGTTPAIGGGLSVGYRVPLKPNSRWKLEVSAGAGYYPLHYDVFHNTPNVKDGLLVETLQKDYFGLDRLSVSLAYTFDWTKRTKIRIQ